MAATKPLQKELDHFKLVNRLRAKGFTCPKGQRFAPNKVPLKFDCRLWRASQLHSKDMANKNYFSHTSKDGRSPWDRAKKQGINAGAENIAAGRETASAVLEQWKKSDGHCRGMMNAAMKTFGVGYGHNSKASYRHYWTQMLARVTSADQSCLQGMRSIQNELDDAVEDAESEAVIGEPWSVMSGDAGDVSSDDAEESAEQDAEEEEQEEEGALLQKEETTCKGNGAKCSRSSECCSRDCRDHEDRPGLPSRCWGSR